MPATGSAVPHLPLTSSTTNACSWPARSGYVPPAAQLPGAAHATEGTAAIPSTRPAFKDAKPGTGRAVPQIPRTWLTTNGSLANGPARRSGTGRYQPATVQLPAEAHDTVPVQEPADKQDTYPTPESGPLSRRARPGTCRATPHVPRISPATNARVGSA